MYLMGKALVYLENAQTTGYSVLDTLHQKLSVYLVIVCVAIILVYEQLVQWFVVVRSCYYLTPPSPSRLWW